MTRRARTSGPWTRVRVHRVLLPPLFSRVASSFFVGPSCGRVPFCTVLWILFNCFIVVLSSPSRFFLHWSFPRNVLNSLGRLANKRPQISRIGNYVGHWLFVNNLYRYTHIFNYCETCFLSEFVRSVLKISYIQK